MYVWVIYPWNKFEEKAQCDNLQAKSIHQDKSVSRTSDYLNELEKQDMSGNMKGFFKKPNKK